MEAEDTPLSLPGTQDINTEGFSQSQSQSQSQIINQQPKIWGRLCPASNKQVRVDTIG